MKPIREVLTELLLGALAKTLGEPPPSADIHDSFEIPKEEKFGDISSHLVLKLAKDRRRPPRALADEVQKHLESSLASPDLGARISKVSVEGPGFLNFYYSQGELSRVLLEIHKAGDDFGRPKVSKKKNVLLEYVSANPTGPLTVAHGRQAALGDSLANLLKFCGHRVHREYYNNDEGVQINTLAASLRLRVERLVTKTDLDAELPETYYRGEYLVALAKEFIEKYHPTSPFDKYQDKFHTFARDRIMEGIKKDLHDFGVDFDNYYSQEALGVSGKVERTLELLKSKGVVYEKEGATWLRSTDHGDDKDRVLVKSDGHYTYLTPDIAYHQEKFERGFDTLIDLLGPDHHGYIARLKASQTALGHDPASIHVLIAQLVTLYEGQKALRMSTRAGEFVTLREVLDEVGKDAGRFFFLMRKFDAHLDFDLSLAKSQTSENPVFYIQYAHARIESVKGLFREKGLKIAWEDGSCLSHLARPLELRLLRLLGQYEATVFAAEKTLEPYRLVPYLMDLAGSFHRFYAENRVVTEDAALTQARMRLAVGVQQVLRSGLGLLGVSAPLKM
ncbi:MAG: arginine--tRNA ligase [Candidatus Omnitrophica bacterium]|nr:arginine--tRNA ligase [Candidatus Omnitrophota bacterium]